MLRKLYRFIKSKIISDAEKAVQTFHSLHYLRHNKRRQEHLAALRLPLFKKNVLEVGAGIGDHTDFFLDRGCQVTTSDGRDQNITLLQMRFQGNKNVSVIKLDLENLPARFNHQYSIVYAYGILYHLRNPSKAIEFFSSVCTELLLLETCVSPGNDFNINLVTEDKHNFSQAISGTGCRPTRSWIMRELSIYFPYVYLTLSQPSHEEFPIDWNNLTVNDSKLYRSVFVASRQELNNDQLTKIVVDKQFYI